MIHSLSRLFLNTIKSYPKDDLVLYKEAGEYHPISSNDYFRRVKHFALGLKALGVNPEDKLIILSENSPEWTMTDLANLSIGGITVPIYTSLMPEQIKYIINDSDARIVVCSDLNLWAKVNAVKNGLPKVCDYILLQDNAPDGVKPLPEIFGMGKEMDAADPDLFEKLAMSVKPEDIASIIYTSGTTGIPKGVMLTHGNFLSNCEAVAEIIEFSEKDTALSFLPLSHVLERMVTFTYLYKGCTIAYAESTETVAENLLEVRPTVMVSVPRVFEKIYSRVIDNVLSSTALKRKLFFWAVANGRKYGEKKVAGENIPGGLRLKYRLAEKLVFSKVVARTGGRVRFFVSGGAALSKDIAEFFYAMGLVVLEGYGLTETSPVIAVNTFENLRFGSVGKVIPKVEVKISSDGEILCRGPNIMRGYYNMKEETEEVLRDGWFHTGDIGYLDDDGFLYITDRKKDIIVTTGGKNVAPQLIENILKTNPYIAGAIVVGDSRKYISALIVPDYDKLKQFARASNISFKTHKELVKNEKIIRFMQEEIDRYTPNLASYEKIKKILLLDRDFEIEKGEMTPSLKVKRNIIEKMYRHEIDSLYEEGEHPE
jgi:long-chain acyl-CoA synthetase